MARFSFNWQAGKKYTEEMNISLSTCRGIVTIRPAVPEDAAQLRELRLEALAGHPQAFAADYERTKADSAEVWVQLIIENAADNRGVICVASADDRLVGMAGLVRGRWPKTRHSGTIWGVYVQAAWRGLRVGEALLEQCIAWAQIQGVAIVKLGVVTTNMPAIRCYTRCGFSVYGVEPQAIYYEDVFYDELLMSRTISSP